MILDFVVILLTKHIPEQIGFYKDMLELELLFENQNNYGFGKDKRLFIILKKDTLENSHHLTEHKGPQIISFKCNGTAPFHWQMGCFVVKESKTIWWTASLFEFNHLI